MKHTPGIVLITAFTPTLEKIDNLRELVKSIKSYGYSVCLMTHSETPQDIVDRCDYFIYDSDNQINYDRDIVHNRFYNTQSFSISYKPRDLMATHIVPIARLVIGGLVYLKALGHSKVHVLEYDAIIHNNRILSKLDSYLDEYPVVGFTDGFGNRDNTHILGCLFSVDLHKVDVSVFPTDSEQLIKLFRDYFYENRNPITERLFYDLIWSNYPIKLNDFDNISESFLINTSGNEKISYAHRTYSFYENDGYLHFFAENTTETDWRCEIIINDFVTKFSVNANTWYKIKICQIESITSVKLLINNIVMEDLDVVGNKGLNNILDWVHYEEHTNTNGSESHMDFDISFDMVPVVKMKETNGTPVRVEFIGLDENKNETLVYQVDMSPGTWSKPNIGYSNWKVLIDGDVVYKTDVSLDKVCAVVSAYPSSEDVKDKTIQTLRSIKHGLGIHTICSTHIDYVQNPDELIREADNYIMNPINTLTEHSYYRYFRGVVENYSVFLDLWSSENASYHGPAVHQCYYNGIRLAKDSGYEYAILTNFDMVFSENDIHKIRSILNTVLVNKTDGFFFHSLNEEGPIYTTVFCVVNIDMFLRKFPNEILNEDDYKRLVHSAQSETNGLENVYYHILKEENLTILESSEPDMFESDECMTNSQAEYLAVIPFKTKNNEHELTTNHCIFIRKPNKNIIERLLVLEVIDLDSDEVSYSTQFTINSDFMAVTKIDFDRTKRYKVLLSEYENKKLVKETTKTVMNFDQLESNGLVLEN